MPLDLSEEELPPIEHAINLMGWFVALTPPAIAFLGLQNLSGKRLRQLVSADVPGVSNTQ